MIEKELAQRLVERITPYINNRMMITDENGIVIASSKPEILGIYNRDARQLLLNGKERAFVDDNQSFPGCKAGIHIVFYYDSKPAGVIGMAGTRGEELVRQANMIKLSIESMLEYELLKKKMQLRENSKNRLFNMILYENSFNSVLAESATRDLGYDPFLLRLPVLFGGLNRETASFLYDSLEKEKNQDFNYITRFGEIIVFKAIDGDSNIFCKKERLDFVSEINKKYGSKAFVGIPSGSLSHYKYIMQMLSWLRGFKSFDEKTVFLSDYLFEYCVRSVPKEIFCAFFDTASKEMNYKTREAIIKTISVLYENNLNIAETAKSMGIHRNTVIFRLNKIRSELMLDPINNIKDQWFLKCFSVYLQENNK
ncbi:MAG: sugar diacid recognition domain-containing protein [Lachnospiraceae bacterium]|nr:sugar diacid recognition domain-containing protein [Lachnospiraceae bacterium]